MRQTKGVFMRLGLLVVLWSISSILFAGETVRVTDKLIVGLYETNNLSGKPLTLLRTDTPLEIINKEGNAWQVKASDGTVGWMKKTYLTTKKSSKIQLIELQIKYRASQDKLKKREKEVKALKKDIAELKKNKGSGVSNKDMDKLKKELKNARNALAEVKKQKEDVTSGKVTAADAVALKEKVIGLQGELSKATDENVLLKADLEKLRQTTDVAKDPEITSSMNSVKLKQENQQLHERLEKIKIIVEGEEAEQTWLGNLSIVWILIMLCVLLIAAFAGGIAWLDFRQRRRHGGFRI